MTQRAQSQWLLLAVVGIVSVGIFFLGKNNPTALVNEEDGAQRPGAQSGPRSGASAGGKASAPAPAVDLETLRKQATQGLDPETRDSLARFREQGNTEDLARFWQRHDAHLLSGLLLYRQAKSDSTLANWKSAASALFRAEKAAQDSLAFRQSVRLAREALKNVLAMDPDNLNAKADLAINYIEGDRQVMQGVGLLKEVLQAEPNNTKALFYLGVLSIQSNQLDKALERFEKLVDLQPQNAFNYYYLGQVHMRKGNRKKALSAFRYYRERVNDPKLRRQAQDLIEQLQKR
jgi:tetratricopeptide (TPR) repeat protein